MGLVFNSNRGLLPSTEARRYVQRVLVAMLNHELDDQDGWMFGGIEEESDQRRLRQAIKAEIAKLTRMSERRGESALPLSVALQRALAKEKRK